MIYLRQSTASQEIPIGYFVDATDGNTEETGLTIANTDIKLWKNGAITLANKNSGGATHISNGIYYAVLDATDTNTLGSMVVFVHVAGALTNKVNCVVLPANIYDSWIAGTDYQSVDVANIDNSTGAIANLEAMFDGTGYAGGTIKLGVDAVALSGDTIAADNAELFFDGTGYAGGGTKLQVNAVEINSNTTAAGNLRSAFDGTGYVGGTIKQAVDTVAISGDTVAADNAEAMFDGTGYNASTSTVGTVTNLTNPSYTVDQIADGVWDELLTGAAHNTATSAGRRLRQLGDAISGTVVDGAPTSTSFGTSLSGYADDFFNDQLIRFTSGSLSGQVRIILDFANAGDVVTVDEPLTSAPANGDGFDIVPVHAHPMQQIVDGVWDELTSAHTTAGTFGKLEVDVTKISSDATAADNLELFFDGTGYSAAASTIGTVTNLTANNDKTGYTLSAAGVDAIFDEPTAGHTTAGTFGEQLKTDIDAILDDTGTAGVVVATNNDKTGYTLTAAGIDAIWDELTSGHVTAGSFAERIATDIPAILTDTGTAGVIVATNNDKTDYTLTAAGVDAILDEVVEGALTLRQIVRIFLSVLAGKSTGGGTGSVTFRDAADVKARVSATLDASGNRTAMTLDGS